MFPPQEPGDRDLAHAGDVGRLADQGGDEPDPNVEQFIGDTVPPGAEPPAFRMARLIVRWPS
eukprot:9183183-Alexandrium_andersonii.AAC.1